jgi:hippurate hydrolase
MSPYGVVGVLRNGDGPVVLVRTDMDGLPVLEQTGLPYASKAIGRGPAGDPVPVMHACGHDMHMTSFLGTATILAKFRDRWKGTVVLVAQPAEEVGAGAQSLLRGGIYERVPKPDFAIALHNSASLEAGKVGYIEGYALANIDAVDVTIRGVGGHGAAPASTKDPIVVAAQFINALQTIVSREITPTDPTVVTVGSIHGGTKRNVIPDSVKLELTVRTYKADVREKALKAIARIAKGTAAAAGLPEDRMPIVEVIAGETGKATYNDPALTRRIAERWSNDLGAENVQKADPVMVSEDFGDLGLDRQIPISLFWLGTVDPAVVAKFKAEGKTLPALHSSLFAPLPPSTIRTGVKATTLAVWELLAVK